MLQFAGAGALLTRAVLLIAIAACALLNGSTVTAVFDWVDYTLRITTRGYPFVTRGLVYNYGTPLVITVMTLAIAGIPAALYERARGLKTSTPVSLCIWLAATVALSWQPILMLAGTVLGTGDELN